MGHAVLDTCRTRLSQLPPRTVVAINAETGEIVAAASEEAALTAFEERFGWGVPACVHVIEDAAEKRSIIAG
jgi:hypothetical protein